MSSASHPNPPCQELEDSTSDYITVIDSVAGSASAISTPPEAARREERSKRFAVAQTFARIPLFWKFQLAGAAVHAIVSMPLKLVTFEPLRSAVSEASGGAVVIVTNSGRWIEPPPRREPGDASGFGLESLRRRLALLYGAAHRFKVLAGNEEVMIRIQLPTAPPSPYSAEFI
jgi:hypothetical protein